MGVIRRMYVKLWLQNPWFFEQICKIIGHDWHDLGTPKEPYKNRYICLRCGNGKT